MKSSVLALVAALTVSAGSASAASYQMLDGTIVDPIQDVRGGDSAYSGPNLEPFADLANAKLDYADLYGANLYLADLYGASLTGADLRNAALTEAGLTDAVLFFANLEGSINWYIATWNGAKYSINAVDNNGDPIPDTIFPVGMDQAWRDAAGMVAVPEPTTALLVGLGLIGLSVRRRVS